MSHRGVYLAQPNRECRLRTCVSIRFVAIIVVVLRQGLQAALVVTAPKSMGPPSPAHRKCPVWRDRRFECSLDSQTDGQPWGGNLKRQRLPEGTSVSTPLSSATFRKICRRSSRNSWVNQVGPGQPGQAGKIM